MWRCLLIGTADLRSVSVSPMSQSDLATPSLSKALLLNPGDTASLLQEFPDCVWLLESHRLIFQWEDDCQVLCTQYPARGGGGGGNGGKDETANFCLLTRHHPTQIGEDHRVSVWEDTWQEGCGYCDGALEHLQTA